MVQKLKPLKVEEKLKSLGVSVFTPREVGGVFGVKQNTVSTFIKRNSRHGFLLKLRNGFYVLKDSNPSLYLIANKLYQPSYVSMEKALAYYRIIPEVVYTVTSVTTKPTREFETPKGTFSYQRIKRDAFTGYDPVHLEGSTVWFATPEKALADYLYFVDLGKISLNDRLNLRSINKKKLVTFAKLFQRSSLLKRIEQIYAEQGKPRRIY